MKRRWLAWLWPAGLLLSTAVYADGGSPVEVYQQEALLREIDSEQHLKQVQADQCQLVQDIELRARQAEYPAYQFLWGDMLTEGVCIPQNPELGVYYLRQAAQQALPAAFLRAFSSRSVTSTTMLVRMSAIAITSSSTVW